MADNDPMQTFLVRVIKLIYRLFLPQISHLSLFKALDFGNMTSVFFAILIHLKAGLAWPNNHDFDDR